MSLSYSHGREFVEQVRPFLEQHDPHGLVQFLERCWPHDQVRELLACGHPDAPKVAAVCLSLMGSMDDNAALAPLLHDEDPSAAAVAEHAMWSIWFQACDEKAHSRLQRAVRLISHNQFDEAINCLDELLVDSPDFAEAYNQRAIAYFLKESYPLSLADCHRTLHLNPLHFGALAGIGHCHAASGQLERALEAYCAVLLIHPRLDGIRQSVQHIRCRFNKTTQAVEPPTRPIRP